MKKYLPAILLIILGISARFLPHPANFAPIGAIAFFGGIYLPRQYSLILPLIAMLISDIFIGFYSAPIMLSVYASFTIMGLIGLWVSKRKKFHAILGGTILGSVFFFILTNLAVWMFGALYAPNLNGLINCYVSALPFFRNSLAGDLFYSFVLIGGMELILWRQRKIQTAMARI
ncbi:MAG: hypothetical protein COU31_00990 [Candidatus Magasanikbacteria bacterium CG10_big_fil_rev_8_21_14_0_10_40_10]|uniref:ECF transporter S component n=1 Tax=Candidatus Magasanikbacteria bacterium CG10_big_fil_rev_8_21_14_0_10_40_10 TaxID=1974648 RepID=A0A2M6W4R8_9BACT|nr:MAG: hypothetical protein COU31_00990 [Candidatus Magasanikbacteria bacterium CG10_big_fil_rev_8_21_14_0_10_40_10]